jgi:hypothetical protein
MEFSEIKSQIKNLGNLKSFSEIKKAGLRVCRNTETGDYWLIEENFLKPVIKSPRESKLIIVDSKILRFKAFVCSKSKAELKSAYALKYIQWGEKQAFDKRPSCSGRSFWWNLGEKEFWSLLWPMIHNDRLAIFLNVSNVVVDHNLFEIAPKASSREPITIFSTLTVMFRELYGRSNLGEGALKTEGIDIVRIMIVNPNHFSKKEFDQICSALDKLKNREIKSIFEECGLDRNRDLREQEPCPLPDRKRLDDIVFDAIGLTAAERKEVYWSVCELVKNRLDKAGSV